MKILVKTKDGYPSLTDYFGQSVLTNITLDGVRAVGEVIMGQKRISVDGYLYGDKLVLFPDKFVPITPAFYVHRDYRTGHSYAVCSECGESHFLKKGKMKVNGHTVSECINCAFKKRGVVLW